LAAQFPAASSLEACVDGGKVVSCKPKTSPEGDPPVELELVVGVST
jgi:hypothetical protein